MTDYTDDRMPDFKNDDEFADWVESEEGRAFMNRQMEKQILDPSLRREGKVEAFLRAKGLLRQPGVPVSIRIPADDLDKARAIAERKGIGYQTWIKMAIHEAIERETR